MTRVDRAHEEAAAAAAEAARIGGQSGDEQDPDDPMSEADRPLAEAGAGEAEGFELAEQELIEHATHGDQHAARRVLQDAPDESDDARAATAGEADEERSSERGDTRDPGPTAA